MKAGVEDGNERLLIEAAQRDPTRFAALYEGNFDRVYAFIARRVSVREEAQDLTAEVFHQALASLESFEWRGAPFVAWLLGIATNVLSGHWRRDEANGIEDSVDGLELAAPDQEIERQAMLSELVESLPHDQRRVIIERFVKQRSIREIAQELGRSEGAVKQLQLRALQSLRTNLRRP